MKETLKQAGYTYISFNKGSKEHVILNNDTNQKEIFFANKNHSSWGLVYKNTHLEFARSLS